MVVLRSVTGQLKTYSLIWPSMICQSILLMLVLAVVDGVEIGSEWQRSVILMEQVAEEESGRKNTLATSCVE